MNTANIEQDSFMNSLIVFVKGSLIFVVSQAWNSAVQNLIETHKFDGYAKIYYAFAITFIAVYVLKMISNVQKFIESCKKTLNGKCKKWVEILNW